MSIEGYNLTRLFKPVGKGPGVRQAVLFVVPSLVTTGVSMILFSLLTNFTPAELNRISLVVFAAIIISLVGAAGVQLLVYRMIEDREHFSNYPAMRAIKAGIFCSLIVSVVLAALVAPYFVHALHLSFTDYLALSLLTLMYAGTWVITSAFWASERYSYPAAIFTISYLGIFVCTYVAYRISPGYTLAGFTIGTGLLLLTSCLGAIKAFRRPAADHRQPGDLSRVLHLASQNVTAIAFNILYVLAVFLDKILVWVAQGRVSGQGVTVMGPYTEGAFLGLIPMLSVAVGAYFANKTKLLVEQRYSGTLTEIQSRIEFYKSEYWSGLKTTLLIALTLAAAVSLMGYFFIPDGEVLRILVTICCGSVLFSGIVFNSLVLPIFGRSNVSVIAVLAVIVAEMCAIPFLGVDVWYSALGFLTGSLVGFLISGFYVFRLFSRFEFNIFRLLLKSY